jgi:uncharacterized membrane-anchored protein YhcB (DUF1043 family)
MFIFGLIVHILLVCVGVLIGYLIKLAVDFEYKQKKEQREELKNED